MAAKEAPMKAIATVAAAFLSCPRCNNLFVGRPSQPGGDCEPFHRIDDLPEPRDVTCRHCDAKVTLFAPWHKRGVYKVLDAARALADQLVGFSLILRQHELPLQTIRRPVGYEQGAGDCWAVWWQQGAQRHEVVLMDVTGGPAIFGHLPTGIAPWCAAQGWSVRGEP
jgi:hypothetical protein